MRGKVELRWPNWMGREMVAMYTDMAPGAIDQLVKRGLFPRPHLMGEAKRWSREEVDSAMNGDQSDPVATPQHEDPYDAGADRAAQIFNPGGASAPRSLRSS